MSELVPQTLLQAMGKVPMVAGGETLDPLETTLTDAQRKQIQAAPTTKELIAYVATKFDVKAPDVAIQPEKDPFCRHCSARESLHVPGKFEGEPVRRCVGEKGKIFDRGGVYRIVFDDGETVYADEFPKYAHRMVLGNIRSVMASNGRRWTRSESSDTLLLGTEMRALVRLLNWAGSQPGLTPDLLITLLAGDDKELTRDEVVHLAKKLQAVTR